jgi:hypothetical protein
MQFVANGVSGVSGRYAFPSLNEHELAQYAIDNRLPPAAAEYLATVHGARINRTRGLHALDRPENLTEAGWGVVCHENEDPAVLNNLQPLLKHRKVGRDRIFRYKDGETVFDWLTRYRTDAGVVNPERVPYYLLLAGSPARIPFEFAQDLDAVYCVGRLCFADPANYGRYAEAVISDETATTPPAPREAVFLGTQHPGDANTEASAQRLIRPLYENSFRAGRRASCSLGDEVNWNRFRQALGGGPVAPAFVLAAAHGVEFPCGDPHQRTEQGALVCNDWRPGGIAPTQFFSAADVDASANLSGAIACAFACYGGGTPAMDPLVQNPVALAPEPFVSALAESLLSLKGGPALAFIGHVGRALGFSFLTPNSDSVLDCFNVLVDRICSSQPAGLALDGFNAKYAALSVQLERLRRNRQLGANVPDEKFATTWLACNDAGGCMLFGDPAVRLRPGTL